MAIQIDNLFESYSNKNILIVAVNTYVKNNKNF